jgi:hypothetical protein
MDTMKEKWQSKVKANQLWVLGTLITLLIVVSYFYYLVLNRDWLVAIRYLVEWLLKPYAIGSFDSLSFSFGGVLLTLSIFLLGFSIALSLLFNKKKRTSGSSSTEFLCVSILTGYGFTGVFTMILAILGQLKAELMLLWLAASIIIVNIISYKIKGVSVVHLVSRRNFSRARSFFVVGITAKHEHKKLKIIVLIGVGILFAFVFFHALLFPVIEWDAVVYHAEISRLWFIYSPDPPLMAGPSVGIQMSGNYPALFPAIGAFYDITLNQFNDIYLRLVSPVVAIVLALLVYESGKEIANITSGLVAVVLMATCPLFLMYSIWATSYMLLATYVAASLFFFIKGTRHNNKTYFFIASLFLGFTLSTSYLGVMLLAFYILVVLVKVWKKQFTVKETLLYSIPVIATGSIQYIRNAIVLGNPVYPQAHSFLGGLFLDNRIVDASLAEISNNAMGYWFPWSSPIDLFLKQVHSIFFDKSLLPISSLLVIPGIFLAVKKKDQQSLLLGSWWFFVVALQLLQGWYWIRTLLIILPAAVLLTVWTIANSGVFKSTQSNGLAPTKTATHDKYTSALKSPKVLAVTLTIILCSSFVFPALTLSFVGSKTPTWPTQLTSGYKYDNAWLNIGNVNGTLFNVFDGDYSAWEWLNNHLVKGEKVATFDCRTYYIDDPSCIFYLDGKEAVPLYEMTDLTSILDFLSEASVKYIWLPSWVVRDASQHPLYQQLPFRQHLGSQYLPEIQVFPPAFNSILYEVRPQGGETTELSVWYDVIQEDNRTIVPADQSMTRLYISTSSLNETTAYQVNIHYLDKGTEPAEINFWNMTSNIWTIGFSTIIRYNTDSWRTHTFTISATSRNDSKFAVLGVYANGVDFEFDYFQVTPVQVNPTQISPD